MIKYRPGFEATEEQLVHVLVLVEVEFVSPDVIVSPVDAGVGEELVWLLDLFDISGDDVELIKFDTGKVTVTLPSSIDVPLFLSGVILEGDSVMVPLVVTYQNCRGISQKITVRSKTRIIDWRE